MRRTQRPAQEPAEQIELLVGATRRGQAGQDAACAAGSQALLGCLQGLAPRDGQEMAVLLDQRRGHALVTRPGERAVAADVAEPAVVDRGVLARDETHELATSSVDVDVAAHGAGRADARRVLEVPRTRQEAI